VALTASGAVYAWGDCHSNVLGTYIERLFVILIDRSIVVGLPANQYSSPMLCDRLRAHHIVAVLAINTYNHRATLAVGDDGAVALFGALGSLPNDTRYFPLLFTFL
jgi:hypothetical protein